MKRPRKDQDEKELEKLAKKLLSTPPQPREDLKGGKPSDRYDVNAVPKRGKPSKAK